MNKLVDGYNNSYHCSISKKLINTNYSALIKEIETNPKASKLNVTPKLGHNKGYTKTWSREMFAIDFVLKTKLI